MDTYKKDSFLKSKFFVGFVGFILGISSVFFWQALLGSQKRQQLTLSVPFPEEKDWDPFFDDFLNQNMLEPHQDPFSKLEEMREKMMKRTHPFDSWYQRKFGGGAPGEVKKREDDQFIYYDISVQGLDQQNLSVKVEEGQIEIQGVREVKDDRGNMVSSSFHRSFPVPIGVLSQKVEIEHRDDKLILRFPKIKESN